MKRSGPMVVWNTTVPSGRLTTKVTKALRTVIELSTVAHSRAIMWQRITCGSASTSRRVMVGARAGVAVGSDVGVAVGSDVGVAVARDCSLATEGRRVGVSRVTGVGVTACVDRRERLDVTATVAMGAGVDVAIVVGRGVAVVNADTGPGVDV